MAPVSIKDVRKLYGELQVLHGISFDIEDGEFVVLVGPSGCGKSTLLRMIAGLEAISAGTISVDDKVVNEMAPKERDIAMVFQSYALYPHMNVSQNMGFSLKLRGVSKQEAEVEVAKAAAVLGLSDLLHRYPRELSGGQRQRVAMGRAIVRNPKVFLFDEPLSNLDAKLRVKMRTEVKDLHQRLGSTSVYVTHDQIEAMTMADKIVVMNDGRIEQVGSPLELYDNPDNIFVAGFLGSPGMNFLAAKTDGGPGLVLADGTTITVRNPPEARDLIFGIRPEDIVIDPQNGTPARVSVVEPTGSETYIVAQLAGEEVVCVARERVECLPGDMIPLGFTTANSHFFDPTTTNRIVA